MTENQSPPNDRRRNTQQISTPVLVCVTIVIVALLGSVVALALLGGPVDHSGLIVTVLGSITAIIASLVTLARISDVSNKQDGISIALNGRLTQLLEERGKAGHARGMLEATGAIAAVTPGVVMPPTPGSDGAATQAVVENTQATRANTDALRGDEGGPQA